MKIIQEKQKDRFVDETTLRDAIRQRQSHKKKEKHHEVLLNLSNYIEIIE